MRTDWECIAFTKTVGWQPRDRSDDELVDYAGLVAWGARRGLIDAHERRDLLTEAARRPQEAEETAREARSLRTLLYQIFSRIGRRSDPEPARVDELNGYLRRFLPERRLSVVDGHARWTWRTDPSSLDGFLADVVWSATELLTGRELERLRLCDADDCGWLFIDVTKNRSRRWCDMSDCGNRSKVRRFRERRRAAKRSEP